MSGPAVRERSKRNVGLTPAVKPSLPPRLWRLAPGIRRRLRDDIAGFLCVDIVRPPRVGWPNANRFFPQRGSAARISLNRQDQMAENTAKKTNALQKPLQPSPELAAVVGAGPVTRGEVVSKIWDYIKKNKLQNEANKREILADDKLKKLFDGKDKVNMFEMNKYFSKHLT
jgi:hypothetical protein